MAFRELRALPHDSDNDLLRKLVDSIAISIGQRGHDVLDVAAGQRIGEWVVLHALTAATFIIRRDGTAEILSLAAGDRLYGQITTAQSISGVIELYRDN